MNYTPEIFISYAWQKQPDGSNWPPVLQQVYQAITDKGYKVIIDVNSIKYKDSIKSFMQKLGDGNYIIVVISDKYMRSLNCMYEVLQIFKYPNYRDRIFPIVMDDAKVYDTKKIIEYIKHWDAEIQFLNNEAKSLSNIAYAGPIFEDIEIMNEVRRIIANFGSQIGDMNVLNIETHEKTYFQELLTNLEQKIKVDSGTIDIKTQNAVLKKELEGLKEELEDFKVKYSKAILDIKDKEREIETLEIKMRQLASLDPIDTGLNNTKIKEFESLLGFTRYKTKEDVIKILGNPTTDDFNVKDNKYKFSNLYYDDFIVFSYYKDSHKLMAIDVFSRDVDPDMVIKYVKSKGLLDEKVNFLGKHVSQIINTFGKPDRVSSDNYSYTIDNLHVNFICYDTNNYQCTSIQVQYFN